MEAKASSSMNLMQFARKQYLNTPTLAIEKPLSGTSPLLSLYFFIKTRASPGITFSPVRTNTEQHLLSKEHLRWSPSHLKTQQEQLIGPNLYRVH